MPIIKSSDYHDFVIKDGEFIGEFDQMYQQVADPWGCVDSAGAFKNDLLVGALAHLAPQVKRALDIGCGLGALTERLRQALPSAEWHACDVSPTAIESALQQYRQVRFFQHDLTHAGALPCEDGAFDLVTMAEVMWYVLPTLPNILGEIYRVLRPGGHSLILQYFLSRDEQKYGREIVASTDDLLRFMCAAGFKIRQDVYIGQRPPQDLLLWATKP